MRVISKELRTVASVCDKVPSVTVSPQSYRWLTVNIALIVPLLAAQQVAIWLGLLVALVAHGLVCVFFGLVAPHHEQVVHLVGD